MNVAPEGNPAPISPKGGKRKIGISDPVYGRLTEAPGRLTPTGQGRIKPPPTGGAPSLKKEATSFEDFEKSGVCFSIDEAAELASKTVTEGGECGNDAPFNIETCDASFDWTRVTARDETLKLNDSGDHPKAFISSNSTVVTNTSASTFGGDVLNGNNNTPLKEPPLDVVRTSEKGNNSDDEHVNLGGIVQKDILTSRESKEKPPHEKSAPHSTATNYNDKLLSKRESRQGRSLQRWLMHSETEELVRQVAGCIPITRDGRVILVSASRKPEWILPKGGWDSDEMKSECAARETFEEAGVLGSLGACLEPIDYETSKSKKRRASGDTKAKDQIPPTYPKSKKAKVASSEEGAPTFPDAAHESKAVSDPESCRFNRLFLFPLFVTDVKKDWPEKGRLRKLVDIDEAIAIMEREDRPYFRAGLLQVKARGLNSWKHPAQLTK